MAKGYDNYKNRMDLLSSFGRELTRRSKSSCELCGTSGVGLTVYEVPPKKEEPAASDCVFICGECRGQIENLFKFKAPNWKFLSERIWSEIPAVKVLSVMILNKISASEGWAADLLEEVYLTDEEREWIDSGEL